MEKAREFIKNHKKEIIFAACGVALYRIGYGRGFGDYKTIVNNVFDTMQKHGYQTVRLIEPGVKA